VAVLSEASSKKYDITVGSMIGLLKYDYRLPFNRLDGLQGGPRRLTGGLNPVGDSKGSGREPRSSV
jgi:hypothetical protein